MATRCRSIAGLAFGFLGAALVIGALNPRSERRDVQLLFVGYTNVPLRSCGQDLHQRTMTVERPVLLVTNSGRIPIQILPIWEVYGRTNMDAHRNSYLLMVSSELKPGESVRAQLFHGANSQIFQAELAYYPIALSHRLAQRVRSSTNAAFRSVAKLLSQPPKPRWARSEPILNLVSHVSRYHIAELPPLVRDDLLAPPKFE